MKRRLLHVFSLLLLFSILLSLLLLKKGREEVQPKEVAQSLNLLLPASTEPSQTVVLKDNRITYHLSYQRFKTEFPFLQSYKCRMLADEKDLCQSTGGRPFFLLAIKSHPLSFDRRVAIRQTWATEREISGYLVRHVMLMATSPQQVYMNLVKEEIKSHQDILLWDFEESHHNLSLKERCFLEWLYHNCQEAEFIFKGDDDEFINPEALVRYLRETATASQAIHGNIQTKSVVMRYGKYEISASLFPYLLYPYFPSGGGFIMPRATIPALYNASLWIPVFPLDDVYFGFLGLAANLTYHHDDRFYVFGLFYTPCRFRDALIVHGISPENLFFIWKDLQNDPHCDFHSSVFILIIFTLLMIVFYFSLCFGRK